MGDVGKTRANSKKKIGKRRGDRSEKGDDKSNLNILLLSVLLTIVCKKI